jgi:hypothetical protein
VDLTAYATEGIDARTSLDMRYRLLDKLGLDTYVLEQTVAHTAGKGLCGVAFFVLGILEGTGCRSRSETIRESDW